VVGTMKASHSFVFSWTADSPDSQPLAS
jgi:hypothetical protein